MANNYLSIGMTPNLSPGPQRYNRAPEFWQTKRIFTRGMRCAKNKSPKLKGNWIFGDFAS